MTEQVSGGPLAGGPPEIVVGRASEGLIWRARHLLNGMASLLSGETEDGFATHFLAGTSMEMLLKAHLYHVGYTKKDLDRITHNLVELWNRAASRGLAIPDPAPRWCVLLSSIHDRPYFSQFPASIAGYIGTDPLELHEKLYELLGVVESAIRPERELIRVRRRAL